MCSPKPWITTDSQINKIERQFIQEVLSRKKFTAKAQCQNKLRVFWNYIPTFLRCSNDSYYKGLFDENEKRIM